MTRLRIGVVGLGYWGPNLLRNFMQQPRADVVAVADRDPARRSWAERTYPSLRVVDDAAELLRDPGLDAVVLATPPATHHPLALAALEGGKHVLVEKPLAHTPAEAEELVGAAREAGRVLLVDHTFVYTSAVQRMGQAVREGALGALLYFDSVRISLGLAQTDHNVLWDLAVHDLSILSYLTGRTPVSVSAVGARHIEGYPESMAYLTCTYDDGLIAHVHANWVAPMKVRRILLGGSRQMVVYDDVEPVEKVRIYDKGVVIGDRVEGQDIRVQYRTGDMYAPFLAATEALARVAEHFVACTLDGATPQSGGESGLDVVRVLAAADRSLAEGGRAVPVEGGGR